LAQIREDIGKFWINKGKKVGYYIFPIHPSPFWERARVRGIREHVKAKRNYYILG